MALRGAKLKAVWNKEGIKMKDAKQTLKQKLEDSTETPEALHKNVEQTKRDEKWESQWTKQSANLKAVGSKKDIKIKDAEKTLQQKSSDTNKAIKIDITQKYKIDKKEGEVRNRK